MPAILFRTFSVRVDYTTETNDHQVRLFGDDVDLIGRFWHDMIGLDPDDILVEPSPLRASAEPRVATIARCHCGVVDCDSTAVTIVQDGDTVRWLDSRNQLAFPAEQYVSELRRALLDSTWETVDRTAARLVRERIGALPLAQHDLRFEWASGTVSPGEFTVSLGIASERGQILVSVPATTYSAGDLAESMLAELARAPREWLNVRYHAEAGSPTISSLGGSGWRSAAV